MQCSGVITKSTSLATQKHNNTIATTVACELFAYGFKCCGLQLSLLTETLHHELNVPTQLQAHFMSIFDAREIRVLTFQFKVRFMFAWSSEAEAPGPTGCQ